MNLLTVIIPTHRHENRLDNLADLIGMLLNASNSKYIEEILIIDSGDSLIVSSDRQKVLLSKKVRIVSEPKIGLSYARNTGVLSSKTDTIAFLDDDVTVSKFWAENIIHGHNKLGVLCVGGPVLVEESKNKKYPNWFSDYFFRFIMPPSFPKQSGIICPPYYLIGANISFKKEVFERFGLFDQDLGRKGTNLLSNEDIEFLARIPKNSIWFEPEAAVSEKILEKRLARIFMMRRLFWQGISDYIMVKKRGTDNFYDRKEVYLTLYFFIKVIRSIAKANVFEALCMFIRVFGYKYGYFYAKRRDKKVNSPLLHPTIRASI